MRVPFLVAFVLLTGLAGCLSENEALVQDEPMEPLAEVVGPADVAELAAAITAAVANGTAVELPSVSVYELGGADPRHHSLTVTAVLEPSAMLNGTWAELDEERIDMPEVAVFEGSIEGQADSTVRITVTPTWIRGVARGDDLNHIIRVGLDGNLPARPEAEMATVQVPDMDRIDGDWQEHECISLVPGHAVKPVVEVGRSAEGELVADIIMDGDHLFHEALGDDALPMLVAFLAETDAIYEHEVGIRFHAQGLHLHSNATSFPDPADRAPLGALADYWNAREVDRDVVHLVTGHDSSYAQANCIGGAGMPEEAYTFTPLSWAERYEVFHIQALAHELGHIFNAHHHYGNHAESELATIMIQGYTPGSGPVFSTLSKSHIRGWAEEYVA